MGSYVCVSGSSVNDYKIIADIPFYTPNGWRSPITGITISSSTMGPSYGDKNTIGDNFYYSTYTPEQLTSNTESRRSNGMWYLDYVNLTKNIHDQELDFLAFDHSVDTYLEIGRLKTLTVERKQYYVDQDLNSVKEQLKNSTLWAKDSKINVPYTFTSKDRKIKLQFNMSNDARYNIRDAYYLQEDLKSADISFFIENTPIQLPKKYIKELFAEVNSFVYNILVEYQRQILNIDSSDNIYDAQVSAAWVYEGVEIPVRTMS